MTVVEKPLANPNMCFICEHSNDVPYWDTHRYFDAPFPLPKYEGRKYVCEGCVDAAAKEFGYLSPKEASVLKEEVEVARREKELAGMVEAFAASVDEMMKELGLFNEPKPEKKSTPKKSTK